MKRSTLAGTFTRYLVVLAAMAIGVIGGRIVLERRFAVTLEPAWGLALAASSRDLVLTSADLMHDRASAPVEAPTDRNTPVVRVFADYACPACQRFEQLAGDSLRRLARAGAIRLEYRYAPIIDAHASLPARALACGIATRQGWRIHEALHRRASARGSLREEASLFAAALDALADTVGFRVCVDSVGDAPRAYALQVARRLGIHEVPAVYVDQRRVRFRHHGALLTYLKRIGSRSRYAGEE